MVTHKLAVQSRGSFTSAHQKQSKQASESGMESHFARSVSHKDLGLAKGWIESRRIETRTRRTHCALDAGKQSRPRIRSNAHPPLREMPRLSAALADTCDLGLTCAPGAGWRRRLGRLPVAVEIAGTGGRLTDKQNHRCRSRNSPPAQQAAFPELLGSLKRLRESQLTKWIASAMAFVTACRASRTCHWAKAWVTCVMVKAHCACQGHGLVAEASVSRLSAFPLQGSMTIPVNNKKKRGWGH